MILAHYGFGLCFVAVVAMVCYDLLTILLRWYWSYGYYMVLFCYWYYVF